MNLIADSLGWLFGWLMFLCFYILGHYGWAIILFTLLTKLILFPLSVSAQKNSIRLLALQPETDAIRRRHAGDKEQINEELYLLYKREKYNPLTGMAPLLVQLPIILGMINVMTNPLRHVLHIANSVVEPLTKATETILGLDQLGYAGQLLIINAVKDPGNSAGFEALAGTDPEIISAMGKIEGIDMTFLGIDLAGVPSITHPSLLLFVPVLAGASAFALCMVQNRLSPAAAQQGALGKWGMTIFLVAFSVYFTLVTPCGVGVYWTASNLMGLVIALVLNRFYNPEKLVKSYAPAAPEGDEGGKVEETDVRGNGGKGKETGVDSGV